jgi:hypothetical protein
MFTLLYWLVYYINIINKYCLLFKRVHRCNGRYQQQVNERELALKTRLQKIEHKIATIIEKGGVGKSLVIVNLATAFTMQNPAPMYEFSMPI